MKQKISGFILAFMLLICIAVPAAAATQGYKFEQKTVSLQVGKSKSLIAYNNGRKVNPRKIRWKSSNPNKVSVTKGTLTAKNWGTAGFPLFTAEKPFTVPCMHIIKMPVRILKDIKHLQQK